nr:hypothetical protein [uncultured Desulfobacter sp.]
MKKQDIHNYCNIYDSLKMCKDIANANKHFGLDEDKTPTVSGISEKELSYSPVNIERQSEDRSIKKPSLEIVTDDGKQINLKDFMNETIESWVDVFDHFGLPKHQKLLYTRFLEIKIGDYVITMI